MTTYRTTALLAILFVALGVYVSTIEIPRMEEEEVQRAETQRLLPFDYRNVTRVVYTTRTARIVMSRDAQRRWRILEPIQARADARQIGNVMRALEIGHVDRVIQEDGDMPEQYGLHMPRVTITLTAGTGADAHTDTIALGDPGPLSSTLYAQRQSDKKIILTTLSVADFRKKTLHTFRLKDIIPFDRAAVDRLQLLTSNKTLTLQRGGTIHGSASRWRFTSPVDAPADGTAVGIVLMTLENLTATGFIDSRDDKRALLDTLDTPRLTATIHTKRTGYHIAFFPPTTPGDDAYAVTSADDPVYRVPAQVLTRLPSDMFHLRDKRLFGMDVEEMALVTVTTNDRRYTIIQQHGTWSLEGMNAGSIDQRQVALFVSRLVGLPAEVAVSPTDNHLERYGLASPAVDIIGVDTRGRRRGRLSLGTQAQGLVYATGAGLPGIYQARSVIVTHIPSSDELLVRETRR